MVLVVNSTVHLKKNKHKSLKNFPNFRTGGTTSKRFYEANITDSKTKDIARK